MDKFKLVKNMLFNYSILVSNIKIIEMEINIIKKNEGKINIDYSEKTGNTYKISKPTEDTAVSNILILEELELKKELGESNLKRIDIAIDSLEPTEKKIIELKYKESKQWWEVANDVKCSEGHCRRLRDRAINKISMAIFGNMNIF